MAGPLEEEVIRKRLLVEGDGGSDDRRIMSLVKTFIRWCGATQLSQEEREATYQKMLFTLAQCEFSFKKTEAVMEMNKREMDRYEQLYRDIETSIRDTQQRIASYRDELKRSKVIQRHRQEYDALAKVIQQHPERQQTERRMGRSEARLARLMETRALLEGQLGQRRRQFHLLFHSLHQLQACLSSPGPEGDVAMDTS